MAEVINGRGLTFSVAVRLNGHMQSVWSPGSLAAVLLCSVSGTGQAASYFSIQVVDSGGAPIPCVTLTTTNAIVLTTDVNAYAAFYEPGLMSTTVWFSAERPGYQAAADGFGYRGKSFAVSEGGSGTLTMTATGSPGPCSPTADQTALLEGAVPDPASMMGVQLVDRENGRGIPLITLSVAGQDYVSDSHGWVALYVPALWSNTATVSFQGHGYRAGQAAISFLPGGRATIRVDRTNLAERLYRITGQGIYRDSVLLGEPVPTIHPVINGLVMGQDSTMNAVYEEKIFWIWGDTSRPSYPLGNFHCSGAQSPLPLDIPPSQGINQTYFVDATGFSRPMAPPASSSPPGPTWFESMVALPAGSAAQQLWAIYGIFTSDFQELERGFVLFDGTIDTFGFVKTVPTSTIVPLDEPLGGPDSAYVYFRNRIRIANTGPAYLDPNQYQQFAPDASGAYSWTTPTATPPALAPELMLDGHLIEPDTGEKPVVHDHSSIVWNPYRQRYAGLFEQIGGSTSYLGEIWYAEADTPVGPWVYTKKIVSHDGYTFYNVRQHDYFADQNGQVIYFEGTYAKTFSSVATATPRYDYNQIMYRLEVNRVPLPVPIYDLSTLRPTRPLAKKTDLAPDLTTDPSVLFYAYDQALAGTIAVGDDQPSCVPHRLAIGEAAKRVLFYALPAQTATDPLVPLYERFDGQIDSLSLVASPEAQQVATVFANPIAVRLPVTEHLASVVADAGDDRCVSEDSAGAGATVTLDATHSLARTGTIAAYTWSWDQGQATGSSATLHLAVGVHLVRLTATDSEGTADTDEILVSVSPGQLTPANPAGAPASRSSCHGCSGNTGSAPAWLAIGVLLLRADRRRKSKTSGSTVTWLASARSRRAHP
jgi:hypothetical protein